MMDVIDVSLVDHKHDANSFKHSNIDETWPCQFIPVPNGLESMNTEAEVDGQR